MNQHYDHDSNDNPDELEKRLSAASLVAPSAEYKQIPSRLQAKVITRGWGQLRWISAGALVCFIATLALMQFDFGGFDATGEHQSNNLIAENTEQLSQSNQTNLAGTFTPEQQYISGTHYIELSNPVDLSDSTTTEVVAFFWYPCWPCSEFEEHLSYWESELSEDITLTRIPAIWSATMRFHARAYYTAQTLGVLDRTHRQFYIQFEKDNPTISNEEELQQFFSSIGISTAEFISAYGSDTTMQLLQNAEEENRAYQIQSTPSMFVAGKFGISPQGAGGFQEMLDVTDFLVDGI